MRGLMWLGIVVFCLPACSDTPAGAIPIRVDLKGGVHPYSGQGSVYGYTIHGVMGAELVLERGQTYVFFVDAPHHPFYFSTDPVGGSGGVGRIQTGVLNDGSGLVTFTPDSTHPDQFYYQCERHPHMGWQVRLVDPPP